MRIYLDSLPKEREGEKERKKNYREKVTVGAVEVSEALTLERGKR